MYLPSSLLPPPSHQPPPPPPRPSPLPSSFHMSSEGSGCVCVFFFTLRTFCSNFQHRTNLSPVCSQESNKISKLLVQYINRCSLLRFCAHIFGKLSKNTICETIKLRITGFSERVIMKSSVAKLLGCKQARNCGQITNGRSQAHRECSCVRKMNRCSSPVHTCKASASNRFTR